MECKVKLARITEEQMDLHGIAQFTSNYAQDSTPHLYVQLACCLAKSYAIITHLII